MPSTRAPARCRHARSRPRNSPRLPSSTSPRTISASRAESGVAFISAQPGRSIIRIGERDKWTLLDFEALLNRLVAPTSPNREQLLSLLLGRPTETLPFSRRRLQLGPRQRILLIALGGRRRWDWTLTIVGG